MKSLSNHVFCIEAGFLSVTRPFCQQHDIAGNRRDVDVVSITVSCHFVKVFSTRVRLAGAACRQQLAQVLDLIRCIPPGVFDPCMFCDWEHHTSVSFLQSCCNVFTAGLREQYEPVTKMAHKNGVKNLSLFPRVQIKILYCCDPARATMYSSFLQIRCRRGFPGHPKFTMCVI